MLCTILSLKSYNMWTVEQMGVNLMESNYIREDFINLNLLRRTYATSRPFNIVRIHTEWLRFLALRMQTMHCNRIFVGAPFCWGWTDALWVTLFDIIWQYNSILFASVRIRNRPLLLFTVGSHSHTHTNKTKAHRAGAVSMDTITRLKHLSPSQ